VSFVSLAAGLLGGIGLFLLGMRLMTDGLKVAAGESLKRVLGTWTSSRARGLLAGALITALVQSSSAVIVATIGFVNAGLLSLGQAVAVVFGSSVGTTMTGWVVAALGVRIQVSAFAVPLVGVGAILRGAQVAAPARRGARRAARRPVERSARPDPRRTPDLRAGREGGAPPVAPAPRRARRE
jgi:phosphate:Na+ symporter